MNEELPNPTDTQQIVLLKKIYRKASAMLMDDPDGRHKRELQDLLTEYHFNYETHAQDAWRRDRKFQ